MKKKTIEEFGILITREMRSMMFDDKLSYEQRAKIFCAILEDESTGDVMMDAFADSLKVGFNSTNNRRKAEILARRERQKNYQRNLRTSTEMSGDKRASIFTSGDVRASLNKAKQSKISISPLNPPLAGGTVGRLPSAVSPDDLLSVSEEGAGPGGDIADRALVLADTIESTEAFGHMRVNRNKLVKCLRSLLKKNCAAGEVEQQVLAGIDVWTETWRADDWRFVPGRITDWLYDGKHLEAPRKKEAPIETDYGEVGVKEIV